MEIDQWNEICERLRAPDVIKNIPVFDGDPRMWDSFKNQVDETLKQFPKLDGNSYGGGIDLAIRFKIIGEAENLLLNRTSWEDIKATIIQNLQYLKIIFSNNRNNDSYDNNNSNYCNSKNYHDNQCNDNNNNVRKNGNKSKTFNGNKHPHRKNRYNNNPYDNDNNSKYNDYHDNRYNNNNNKFDGNKYPQRINRYNNNSQPKVKFKNNSSRNHNHNKNGSSVLPFVHIYDTPNSPPLKFLIDTSSNMSFIDSRFVFKDQIKQINPINVSTFFGEQLSDKCVTFEYIPDLNNERPLTFILYKFPDEFDGLIGADILKQLYSKVNWSLNLLTTKYSILPILHYYYDNCKTPEPVTFKSIKDENVDLNSKHEYLTVINREKITKNKTILKTNILDDTETLNNTLNDTEPLLELNDLFEIKDEVIDSKPKDLNINANTSENAESLYELFVTKTDKNNVDLKYKELPVKTKGQSIEKFDKLIKSKTNKTLKDTKFLLALNELLAAENKNVNKDIETRVINKNNENLTESFDNQITFKTGDNAPNKDTSKTDDGKLTKSEVKYNKNEKVTRKANKIISNIRKSKFFNKFKNKIIKNRETGQTNKYERKPTKQKIIKKSHIEQPLEAEQNQNVNVCTESDNIEIDDLSYSKSNESLIVSVNDDINNNIPHSSTEEISNDNDTEPLFALNKLFELNDDVNNLKCNSLSVNNKEKLTESLHNQIIFKSYDNASKEDNNTLNTADINLTKRKEKHKRNKKKIIISNPNQAIFTNKKVSQNKKSSLKNNVMEIVDKHLTKYKESEVTSNCNKKYKPKTKIMGKYSIQRKMNKNKITDFNSNELKSDKNLTLKPSKLTNYSKKKIIIIYHHHDNNKNNTLIYIKNPCALDTPKNFRTIMYSNKWKYHRPKIKRKSQC